MKNPARIDLRIRLAITMAILFVGLAGNPTYAKDYIATEQCDIFLSKNPTQLGYRSTCREYYAALSVVEFGAPNFRYGRDEKPPSMINQDIISSDRITPGHPFYEKVMVALDECAASDICEPSDIMREWEDQFRSLDDPAGYFVAPPASSTIPKLFEPTKWQLGFELAIWKSGEAYLAAFIFTEITRDWPEPHSIKFFILKEN